MKRARSDCTARFTNRIPDAIFSIVPVGWKSTVTMTRVRLGPISWKLTRPECCVPRFVFQAIRSLARRSVISPSHSRVLNQIFSRHETCLVSFFSTFSTRCMNSGNFSKSTQAL